MSPGCHQLVSARASASPSTPGGITVIYKDLIADEPRTSQVIADVAVEGFDCLALDTLFLAAPIAQKGRLVQYAGRILRPYGLKATAEVHDYHDELTGVLASSLAKRAPGYTSLGFPDPRKLPFTPSADRGTLTRPERQPP
jgi:hypothetical protein